MSAERTREPVPPVARDAEAHAGLADPRDVAFHAEAPTPVPYTHDPKRLQAFADSARRAVSAEERRQTVHGLVELLVRLREPGNERHEAQAILELLDGQHLHDLEDARGRSARREAVETLTSLGYPWAMQVPLDDLRFASDWARTHRAPREEPADAARGEWERRLTTWRWVAAAVTAAFQFLAVFLVSADGRARAAMPETALVAGFSTVMAFGWAVRRPSVEHQVPYAASLVLAVAASVVLALFVPGGAFLSLLGNFGALVAAFGWQYEPAGSDPGSLTRDYEKWKSGR